MSDEYYGKLWAENKQEYRANLENLLYVIQKYATKVDYIQSLDDFHDFLHAFIAEAPYRDPIYISDLEEPISPEHLERLEAYGYPESYRTWVQKYGQNGLFIGAWVLSVTALMEKFSEYEYYRILLKNNYLYFSTDRFQNIFVFDANQPQCPIKCINKDVYLTQEFLGEFYKENYGFYFDATANTYVNPQELDISKIFDTAGSFHEDSVYIKAYLASDKCGKVVSSSNTMLPFLKYLTANSFDEALRHYDDDIEDIADEYVANGQFFKAFQIHDALVALSPQSSTAYNNRAFAYRNAGLHNKALKDINIALQLEPDDEIVHGTKAEILSDLGNEEGFFESFETALKLGMPPNIIDYVIHEKYKHNERYINLLAQYK